MHPRFRLTILTTAALFMWAAPALATRHGGEIPIVGLLLFVVAVPTVFPLVPVVCGMAVHAAITRRFLAAGIIGASGFAAAWSIVQFLVTRDLSFDEAMPRIVVGIMIGVGLWLVEVVRHEKERMWVVGVAALGWVVSGAIALAIMAVKWAT